MRARSPLEDPNACSAVCPGSKDGSRRRPVYTLDVSDPEIAAPQVARALVGAGADILSIAESRHSLEDVYLELIDEDVEARRR